VNVSGGACLVSRERYSKLEVKVNDADGDVNLAAAIDGTYTLLPNCGTANGALHVNTAKQMAFFLESGRTTIPEEVSKAKRATTNPR
tara:strand:+ start:472 stop:732 length:261 start_codon:yes stop_codon:yes gene_type:complete